MALLTLVIRLGVTRYTAEYARVKAIDPLHPVFVLDCPWITPPATAWWVKWNTYGDVTSHDNYPFDYRSTSLATIYGDGGGIPQTVSLAVSANNGTKPVWLCVQAFESDPWLLPSGREMRAQVYTGIVHGATGVIYFAMDSYITRAGAVVGITPLALGAQTYDDPSTSDAHTAASPSLLEMSANLWDKVAELNSELLALTPMLFSPTARTGYTVSFRGRNATDTPIRTLRKQHADGDILIAVNVDNTYGSAMIDLLDAHAAVEVMFEGRTLPLVNGSVFVDAFEPMDTHIYRLIV